MVGINGYELIAETIMKVGDQIVSAINASGEKQKTRLRIDSPNDLEIYNKTMRRMGKVGRKTEAEVIVELQKENEYYREKIERMERNMIPPRGKS